MKDKGDDVKVEWLLINTDEINFEIQPAVQEVSQYILFVVMVEQMVQNVVSKSICHGSSVKPLHLWNPAAPLRITETSLYLADKWLFKHLSSKFNVWKMSVPKYLLSEHFKNNKKTPQL